MWEECQEESETESDVSYKIIPNDDLNFQIIFLKVIPRVFIFLYNLIKFNDTYAIRKDKMCLVIFQYLSECLARDYCRHSRGKWQYCT